MSRELKALYPQKNEKVAAKQLNGELLLLNLETGALYSLNELSAEIFKACNGRRSVSEIARLLSSRLSRVYRVESKVLVHDILEAFQNLEKAKMIRLVF